MSKVCPAGKRGMDEVMVCLQGAPFGWCAITRRVPRGSPPQSLSHAPHRLFALRLDHHSRQRLGAGVANHHAAVSASSDSAARMASTTAGMVSSGFFSRTFTLTITCGKTLRSAVSSPIDLPVRARRSRTTSAVSRPSPVVARCGKRMWPDCSPPRAASFFCISSST